MLCMDDHSTLQASVRVNMVEPVTECNHYILVLAYRCSSPKHLSTPIFFKSISFVFADDILHLNNLSLHIIVRMPHFHFLHLLLLYYYEAILPTLGFFVCFVTPISSQALIRLAPNFCCEYILD